MTYDTPIEEPHERLENIQLREQAAIDAADDEVCCPECGEVECMCCQHTDCDIYDPLCEYHGVRDCGYGMGDPQEDRRERRDEKREEEIYFGGGGY